MEKTFGEIFSETFTVLKKSIPDFLKVMGICLGGTALVVLAGIAILGMEFIRNFNNSVYVQNYLQTSSVTIGLFILLAFLFIFVLYYVCYCCSVLIVRNNVLGYQEPFKVTCSKSLGKFLRVLGAVILMCIVYFLIATVTGIIPFVFFVMKQNIWMLVLGAVSTAIITVILVPPCFTGVYGVLCREGDFLSVFNEAIRLGFKKWFKIFGYLSLMTIICSITLGVVLGIVLYVFYLLHLTILENLLLFVVQMGVGLFSLCYCTILYLDISGEKQPEAVMEPITPLENKPL